MPDFGAFAYHYGSVVGQYRATWRAAIIAAQAANSRLFTIRNKGTNVLIPTSMAIKVMQTGAHTAAIEDSFDVYKLTGFSASDNANQVAITGSRKLSTMPAAPGNVELMGVTAVGAAAGMTGGTMTKDAAPLAQLPAWFVTTEPTSAEVVDVRLEAFAELAQNGYPFILANNEGLDVENRVLLGAAAAASIYIDLAYAEVQPY